MKRKLIVTLFAISLLLSLTACDMNMRNDSPEDDDKTIGNNTASSIISSLDNTPSASQAETKIDEARAKEIALEHAGLNEENITGYRIELDRDYGAISYEIEFYSGNYEYDYDINAENGSIIKSQKDIID